MSIAIGKEVLPCEVPPSTNPNLLELRFYRIAVFFIVITKIAVCLSMEPEFYAYFMPISLLECGGKVSVVMYIYK